MGERIWASQAMCDPRLIRAFILEPDFEENRKAVELLKANNRGASMPSEDFPKLMWSKYEEEKNLNPPDIFCAGFWLVSAAFATVLRDFDLGGGALYPITVLYADQKTPVKKEYYCLNFGNRKTALIPEKSDSLNPNGNPESPSFYSPYAGYFDNDDFALDHSVLEGPDLWIDTQLYNVFFLSDPLAKALKAAKVTRYLGLRRCRIIEQDIAGEQA